MLQATTIVAWIGACTGVASFSWNVYVKSSAGPKLRVKAWARMVKRPAPPGDPQFLRVSIQNIGTAPTTLTNYCLFQYAAEKRRRWRRRPPTYSAVLHIYEGAHTPYKLGVGEEVAVLMEHDLGFDRLLKKGTVYFAVDHSFSTRPVEVPIIAPASEERTGKRHQLAPED